MSTTFTKQNHREYNDYPETPVAKLRDPGSQKDHQVSPMDYCDYHKLHGPLTPLPGRRHDCIKLLREVSQGLEGLRDLSETYMLKDIHGNSIPARYVKGLHVLFGVTKMRQTSKGMRYRNPDYLHYDERTVPITDKEERMAFYNRHKINPKLTGKWLAKHWGLSSANAARKFLERRDVSLRDDKLEAMTRIGRTCLCIREWCGFELKELAEILPYSYTSVSDWASRYGTKTEWNVPRDPREAPFIRESGSVN